MTEVVEANSVVIKTLKCFLTAVVMLSAVAAFAYSYGVHSSTEASTANDRFQELMLLAEDGDPEAQYVLAFVYEEGLSEEGIEVPRDYQEAVKWYRFSAEQGKIQAQEKLGEMYYKGHGVSQDYSESFRWTHLAAEQGLASAQYNLGTHYINGLGTEKNYEEAVVWYRRAAEGGDGAALANLSSMYGQGQGVEENKLLAFVFASLAANLGNEDGVYNRDYVLEMITEQQISEGERLIEKWKIGSPLPTESDIEVGG